MLAFMSKPIVTLLTTVAKLGAFDGAVAALVEIQGEMFLITTHMSYVPAMPPTDAHDVVLRKDFCYGLDDPICWPQLYSDRFCHLGVIRRKEGNPECSILWWTPTTEDLIVAKDVQMFTAAFGKLENTRLAAFSQIVNELDLDYKAYAVETPADKMPSTLNQLVLSMRLCLERLRSLPWTYEHMVQAVRTLQRTCLEVKAFLDYMSLYKPWMENPNMVPGRPASSLMGVYTSNPRVAQMFHISGIPYWYFRRANTFSSENILTIVTALSPCDLELEPHPLHATVIYQTSGSTDKKIEAIHQVSRCLDWYKDPFDSPDLSASTSTSPVASSSRSGAGGDRSRGGGQRPGRGSRTQERRARPSPCKRLCFSPAWLRLIAL
jgi:hypothetical protein